jgi:hypothetical protein
MILLVEQASIALPTCPLRRVWFGWVGHLPLNSRSPGSSDPYVTLDGLLFALYQEGVSGGSKEAESSGAVDWLGREQCRDLTLWGIDQW